MARGRTGFPSRGGITASGRRRASFTRTPEVKELLLPRTDAGVFVQAAVAVVVLTLALVVVRRDRELRLFVIGVTVLATAWFALRSVH